MTPEQKARQEIDRQLQQAGWVIQNQAEMNILAGLGVAVREFKLTTGFVDYKHIVDLVSLVRHAIDPESPLQPVGQTVEERFTEWLSEQQQQGEAGEFTEEQLRWLVAIKGHIASSLMIEQDDSEYAPFNQFGGIGRARFAADVSTKDIRSDSNSVVF